jgi:hypothetical protein
MPAHPSPELVQKKLRDCFPDAESAGEALALLNGYGAQPWHREADRVRLAMLMQSGGDLARLRELAATADRDYRDVLVVAEYPEEFRAFPQTPPAEMAAIRRRDLEQYQRWLQSDG